MPIATLLKQFGSIGKHVKNSRLRSDLITGAMSEISQIVKRNAKTKKEDWIQELVARRGKSLVVFDQ